MLIENLISILFTTLRFDREYLLTMVVPKPLWYEIWLCQSHFGMRYGCAKATVV